VQQVKTYPLAKAGNPPTQCFVDMIDTMCDGLLHNDKSAYTNRARVLNEKLARPRDLQKMSILLQPGIENGREFKPDAATTARLRSAAAEAHGSVLAQIAGICGESWKITRI
jgi:hypothetical protein